MDPDDVGDDRAAEKFPASRSPDEYVPLLLAAVAGLDPGHDESERSILYDRARNMLSSHLDAASPPLATDDIEQARSALEQAICQVEALVSGPGWLAVQLQYRRPSLPDPVAEAADRPPAPAEAPVDLPDVPPALLPAAPARLLRFSVIMNHLLRHLAAGSAADASSAHVLDRRTASTSPGHAVVRLIPIGILIAAVLASGLVYLRVTHDRQAPKGPEPPTSGRDDEPSTQSRIDRAITELTPAVEAEPTTAEAHQHRGEAWARKAAVDQAAADAAATTDLDRAIQEFTEAIRLKPDLAAAYHGRGDSWARKGDQDRAISDLNEAIRRNPNDALAYLTRAAAFVSKGRTDLAIVDLTRVIGLATVAAVRLPGSKLVLAYDTRARLYGLKGLNDREAADLGKMIDICIKDPHAVDDGGREAAPVTMPAFLASAHVRRAEVLLRLRRNADAIADFRKALAIDPDLQKPKDALARLGITP